MRHLLDISLEQIILRISVIRLCWNMLCLMSLVLVSKSYYGNEAEHEIMWNTLLQYLYHDLSKIAPQSTEEDGITRKLFSLWYGDHL